VRWRERDRRAIVRRAWQLVAVLAPALLLMAAAATTPYIYGDNDAYHVNLMRYWFQEQQLGRVSFHSYFVFPLLSSEIAALFVPLVRLLSAKLVQLGFVATERCPSAAHWSHDSALEVTLGGELVIARLLGELTGASKTIKLAGLVTRNGN
jgi:hypothetical protein